MSLVRKHIVIRVGGAGGRGGSVTHVYAAWRGTGRGVHGLIMVDHPPPPPLPHDRLRLVYWAYKSYEHLGERVNFLCFQYFDIFC